MAGGERTSCTCAILLGALAAVCGFNVDTSIPVIKEGPAGSSFGYSVAQHQVVRPISPFEMSDEVTGNYLVIGAPTLNLFPATKENFTGGVYKCNALSPRSDDCERLLQNQFENPDAPADSGRNNQWLGVVVRSGGTGGQVVACAHRYKLTANNYGIGTCYEMSQAMEFNEDMGIGSQLSPCQGLSTRREHEEYAFCQSGTSAYITEDSRLLMGGPGAVNWRGLVSELDISLGIGVIRQINYSPTTDLDPLDPPVPLLSYLGYAVVGGKFDNTGHTYFVAGAPRSQDVGQVIFFSKMASGRILKYEEPQKLSGDLPFSGYGQVLLAVDVNGDGYDDLIVGAPFYHMKEEDSIRLGGAIYIYIGNGDMISTLTPKTLIRGRSMNQEECDSLSCQHGRFGFSLAAAGDLNLDGYNDFAVGAPYEGNGAVYIFHGSENGVNETYSQRIYAEDLQGVSNMTTFGYSLSGGMDLDSNSYPDLLVGAYEVDKVALLRSRPIIHLISDVSVKPTTLNMTSDAQKTCFDGVKKYCVELKICLRYTAEPADRFQGSPTIIYRIEAEPDRINPRVEFKFPTDGTGHVVENTFTLLPQALSGLAKDEQNPRCASVTQIAYLKEQISDVLTTLKFGISYRLPERDEPIPTKVPDSLPDINEYPILDSGIMEKEAMAISEVEFAKKCGDNQICESNLQMEVNVDLKTDKYNMAVLKVGEFDYLKIKVNIVNVGEVAYQTTFYLEKPASLSWQSSDPNNIGCAPINDTLVECNDIGSTELGAPLKAMESSDFTLELGTKNVSTALQLIELVAWVNTTSTELTKAGDRKVIPIRVLVHADTDVYGYSSPDGTVQYSGAIRGENVMKEEYQIGPAINHTYVITNIGSGTVEESEFIISWPYELASKYEHGKHLLYLMESPQVVSGKAVCFAQPEKINTLNVSEDSSLYIRPRQLRVNTGPAYSVGPDQGQGQGRNRREAEASPDTSKEGSKEGKSASPGNPKIGESRSRNAVVLGCAMRTAKCIDFRCKIGRLENNDYVEIKVRARLWESTLIEDFKDAEEVHIQSRGRLHIRPELNVVQPDYSNEEDNAITIAIPSLKIAPKKGIEWWIILVAVIGGLLLLILLALILWKLGFFKRNRPEDVNPTYNVKVEKKKKDHPDETDYFITK